MFGMKSQVETFSDLYFYLPARLVMCLFGYMQHIRC